MQERSGKRKIAFSSSTCNFLLLVTFGTGRRRANRTHRILLVSEEPSVLTLLKQTTMVMAQAVTVSLSELEQELHSVSERTRQVSTTDIAPPVTASEDYFGTYFKTKVDEFRRHLEGMSGALDALTKKPLQNAVNARSRRGLSSTLNRRRLWW